VVIDSKLATALARAFDFAAASQLATTTHTEKDTASQISQKVLNISTETCRIMLILIEEISFDVTDF
jgi:hypothetical protein